MNDYIIIAIVFLITLMVVVLAGSWWTYETIRVVVMDAWDNLIKWMKERFGSE